MLHKGFRQIFNKFIEEAIKKDKIMDIIELEME